jgi:uncharacterized membrane protein YfcA
MPLLVAGAFSGLVAGLFGVGGGVVIVPVLTLLFESQGVDPAVVIKVAVGTSLATIVVTSISSIYSHHRRGAVDWPIWRRIVPGILVGALAGAFIVDLMPGQVLYLAFVAFLYLMALRMFFGQVGGHRPLPGTPGISGGGVVIGVISALMGIGGGTLSVPFLTYCSVPVKRAVATAAAIGLPIALSSTAGMLYTGLDESGLPEGSIGYVNLPAFGGIVVASVLFAPLGARLAHRLPDRWLKRAFALFLVLMASRMAYRLL